MSTNAPDWIYGDFSPDPQGWDLTSLKARWIIQCLPTLADPVVLDFGCGQGKHLYLIAPVFIPSFGYSSLRLCGDQGSYP